MKKLIKVIVCTVLIVGCGYLKISNALTNSQEYVYTKIINVGSYGTATVCTVCSIDTNTEEIWFYSHGNYSANFNSGKSFMVKNIKHNNIKEDGDFVGVKITITFVGTDVNTHTTSGDITATYTISYNQLGSQNNF